MCGGTFLSTAVQWLQQTTLGWLVYELTGSGAMLGVVLGVRAIPLVLLAPYSGIVAERYDRRRVLMLTQLSFALPAFLIALSLAAGTVATWQLIVFTVLSGITTAFDRTLRNALVFDVLPRTQVANGIALVNVAFGATRAIGPAVAGALIALAGPTWNFVIQGLLSLAVVASLTQLSHRPAAATAHRPAWVEMQAGLRYGATDPVVRTMLLLSLLATFLLIPSFSALMPMFAADVFRVGPQGLGALLAAVGLGSLLGSALAAYLSRFDRAGALQALALMVFALSIVGFAYSPGMTGALLLLVIGGSAEMLLLTSTATAMQLSAPEDMRGRVASLVSLFPAFISMGMLAAGWAADLLGAPATAVLFALIAIGIGALSWQRSQVLRGLRLSRLVAGRRTDAG